MKKLILIIPVAILFVFAVVFCSNPDVPTITDFQKVDHTPAIFPDYSDIVLPVNIAPVNFEILEDGDRFLVTFSAKKGEPIRLYQESPAIQIPLKTWKKLLSENEKDTIRVEIFVEKNKQWRRFKTIKCGVSGDSIDPFVYYRDIVPTNAFWNKMYMHQRNLENFDEQEIFNNYRIDRNCMNCHTFNQNNPNQMLFHVRGKHGGTVFYNQGKLKKVDIKTSGTLLPGAYCSWHPGGKLVAFAVNKIKQNYYLSGYGKKMKEVYDLVSDIVIYNVEKDELFMFPQITSAGRENLPCWSADGKYLYYTMAKEYVVDMPNEDNLYSLMRVSYDSEQNSLGEPEVLISSEEIGKSIAFPTVSPDGRFMFFCVVDFGYFPVNNKTSDLYLMDLRTMNYSKPAINSDESESYVSWSNNSRWFVFSSRQLDGMTSKPFICHVDSSGNLSKPFILPQEDPRYYTTDHRNFVRPELLRSKFELDFGDLEEVIFSEAGPIKFAK